MAAPAAFRPNSASLRFLVSKATEVRAGYGSGFHLADHRNLAKGKTLSRLCPRSIYRSGYIVTYKSSHESSKGAAAVASAVFVYGGSEETKCLFRSGNALKPFSFTSGKVHVSNVDGLGDEAKLVTFVGTNGLVRISVISFRRGPLEGQVIVRNVRSIPSEARMATLARAMDDRMKVAN
jgi:hypothetical protein